MPTDYWTRPVYDTNRGWSTVVMRQWLGASELAQYGNSSKYNPYSTCPLSAHILWSTPYTSGGIAVALKGTAAISDESMAAWMEYLYRQDARPTNATGVNVSLYAIDPNGNYIDIGTTTSDSYGNYAIAYQPEVPGTYQIIATFAGTNSYYGSSASSYLTVGAEASTSNSEASIVSAVMTYTAATAVAIIIAIAIAVILILRKK